jgi:NADH:ubiquinone oxidoreductase subunit 5 (subunit L)/multisubunit Na+/H+ antiporter MnhA subunit
LYDFGGIANQMPKYTGIAMIGMFAALGLPGLNGFVSELFSFLGAFEAIPMDHNHLRNRYYHHCRVHPVDHSAGISGENTGENYRI